MAKEDFKRVIITVKDTDPLFAWLESKVLPGERAPSTAATRLLRQMMAMEEKGLVPPVW